MKTQHTPAPWNVTNLDTAETVFYIQCKSGNLGSAYNKAGGEGLANARLIAASVNFFEYLCGCSNQGDPEANKILKSQGYVKGIDY